MGSACQPLFGAFDLCSFYCWRNRGDNFRGYLILQIEYVAQISVHLFSPKMGVGGCFDQLAGNANTASGLPNTSLQHVVHTKLSSDLLDIDGLAFVGKGRV